MNSYPPTGGHVVRGRPTRRVGVVLATVMAVLAALGVPALSAGSAQAADVTHGLRADYFAITNTSTWALEDANRTASVLDPDIDVDDMLPVYRAMTGRTERVGVRWTGFVTAPKTGDYTFSAIGDNGFRLWVGGQSSSDQLIDFYVDQWDQEKTAARPVHLEAGVPTPIRFDQFQNAGGANVHLRWQSADAGIVKTAVPQSAFTPPSDFHPYNVTATVNTAGDTISLVFPGTLAGTDGLASHLRITVDRDQWTPTAVTAFGSTLTLKLGANILAGSYVRVAYDGKGSPTAGGTAVPEFNALVDNRSEYQLRTPWADAVDPKNPLPEYPRPQLARSQWMNLNGPWGFAGLAAKSSPLPTSYAETVTVPYPIESQLSGIERHEDNMAYHRTFTVPAGWAVAAPHAKGYAKNRLMLNFGAVDHEATVYVNGTQVAHHVGGYDAFSADITDALKPGVNDLVVRATDTTGLFPHGKQSANPSGIFYTAASGIWQTVWIEPVTEGHVDQVVTTPTLSDSGDSLAVTVESASAMKNAKVQVTVKDKVGKTIASTRTRPNTKVDLKLGKTNRWTPETPYLYDVDVTLFNKGRTDTVKSYAGIRSIGIAKIDGKNRIVLNGKQTYLLSTLDQGFWPDGVYTAPTDEALAWDIQETKDLGFNTIRKHIKVEPARWYYHADQIGMLVWQDMPSAFTGHSAETSAPSVTDEWERELHAMIDQHRSVTSIIGWIPFNEGWSEWNLDATARVAGDIKADDPTRLVDTHSGVNCCASLGDTGTGDVLDHHAYTGPASPTPDATRAAMDGEHGGFSLSIQGHVWPGGSVNPYGEVTSKDQLTRAYVGNTTRLIGLAREKLSGSVYTQLTDVEGEVNGFWTYDRKVLKMDKDAVRTVNAKVIAAGSGASSGGGGQGQQAPIAGWNLDTVDGTTTPGITGSPDATLKGGASLVAGAHGQALKVNGSDGQATSSVGTLDTTGSYTVSAWVRLDAAPGAYATAVGADGLDGRSAFFLQYKNTSDAGGHGWAMSFPDGPRAIASGDAQLGRWYHLTGVRDASVGTLSIYVDGQLKATQTSYETIPTTGLVTMGRGQWDGNAVDFLNGALDDVRVFNRALSAMEVANLAVR